MTRRAKGEGSVFFDRRIGRWKAVAPWPHRLTRTGKTQQEAIRRRDAALREHGTIRGRQTFAAFLRVWLDTRRLSVRPRTYTRDSGMLKHASRLDQMSLHRIGPQDIQAILDSAAKDLAPASVHLLRALLSQLFDTAIRYRLVTSNPTAGTITPKAGRHVKALSPEARTALRKKIRGTNDEALFDLYILLGPRRGEALALKWADVDLEARTATIRATLQRHEGELIEGETKTAAGVRTLPLPDSLIRSLRQWRIHQKEMRLKAGHRWVASDLVFTTRYGTPMEPRNVLRKLRTLTGDPKVTVHMLRHTAATYMIRAGVPITEVARILGHASPAITLRVYAHVVRDMSDAAREKLNDIADEC